MNKQIFCLKLQKQGNSLDAPPYPGELGQRIYEHISQEAWQLWLNQQTLLINEYRLNMLEEKAQEFLAEQMEQFLFGEGSEPPAGYNPSQKNS